jgi:hypothetical protein
MKNKGGSQALTADACLGRERAMAVRGEEGKEMSSSIHAGC